MGKGERMENTLFIMCLSRAGVGLSRETFLGEGCQKHKCVVTTHQFLAVLYTVQSKLYVKLRASSVFMSTVKNQHDEVGVSLWKDKASVEA